MWYNQCGMHITAYYKITPGQTNAIKKWLHKDPKYPLAVTTPYWDKQENVGAAVRGGKRFKKMFRSHFVPHISLARTIELRCPVMAGHRRWGDSAPDSAGKKCDTSDDKTFSLPGLEMHKKILNWRTTGQAQTHPRSLS